MPFFRGFLAGFAALALAVPGLAQGPASDSRQKTSVAPVDELNLPEVVATVNGIDIKKTDLQKAVETMKMQLEVIGQAMPLEDEVWRRLLEELINTELLAQEAAAKKVTVTESDVDAELTGFRERFPSETVFQNFLEDQGFNGKQIRDEIRKQLRIKKMLDREVYAKISVGTDAAQAFYEKNPAQFEESEAVRASHVLVKVERSADEKTKAEARKEAEQVLADARAGKDFAQLAKEHSDDPGSKERGGDLDFFGRWQMVTEFGEAAFKLNKGEVSGIVSTVFGFHVIKVTDKRPKRTIPFADVKSDLVAFLTEQEKGDSLKSYVEKLRKKAKVQIFI